MFKLIAQGRLMISVFFLLVSIQCSAYYDPRIGTDGNEMLMCIENPADVLRLSNGEGEDLRYCIFNEIDYSSYEEFDNLKEALTEFCKIEASKQPETLYGDGYLQLQKNLICKLFFLGYLNRHGGNFRLSPKTNIPEVVAIEKILKKKMNLLVKFTS